MKSTLFSLLLLFPLLFAGETRAALNPATVPADARWVIYADLNSLRASAIGKELLAIVEKAQIQAADAKIGLDVQKLAATIGTITAYGTNFAQDPNLLDGTLIAQGTPDLRKIAEALILQATLTKPEQFTEVKDLPFPAYAITSPAKGKDGIKGELIVAFPPEPIVLVSKSRAQLLRARDVFRGAAPSVGKAGDAPLERLLKNSAGAILFGASVVPTDQAITQTGPQARILQMATAGSVGLGENGDQTFAHIELVAASDAMADKLMKILQGMAAMMSLAETNDRQLADFLNSAVVARNDDTVTLNLTYASARLAQMAKNLQQTAQSAGASGQPQPPSRPQSPLTVGTTLAEWTAEPVARSDDAPVASPLAERTIENVTLVNGTLLSLGCQGRGGRSVRFDRVEIAPAAGGAPLVFRADFMRVAAGRSNLLQFQFPGSDGTYNLKVFYVNDSDSKVRFAVSSKDVSKPTAPAAEPKSK